MSLHSQTDQSTGSSDLLTKLVAFMTSTVGWTLADTVANGGSPYHIFTSQGESGNESIVLRYGQISGAIEVRAYGQWDATAHTGIREVYLSGSSKVDVQEGTAFNYWFYANKNRIIVVTKVWNNYYCQYSGLLNRFWSEKVTSTSAACAAGSSVVIPVVDASIFTNGRFYQISDGNKIERIKLTAVNTSNTPQTIQAQTLANSYAAGARIGEDLQPVIVTNDQAPGSFMCVTRMDGWKDMYSQTGACGAAHGGLAGYADPELRQGDTILFPWIAAMNGYDCNEIRGELDGIWAYGGNGSQEQLLTDSAGSYRFFNLLGSGWCAIQES